MELSIGFFMVIFLLVFFVWFDVFVGRIIWLIFFINYKLGDIFKIFCLIVKNCECFVCLMD